jgi:hypothetical protein
MGERRTEVNGQYGVLRNFTGIIAYVRDCHEMGIRKYPHVWMITKIDMRDIRCRSLGGNDFRKLAVRA